jgi:hypothetical protein
MYLQSTQFGELQSLPSDPAHRYVISMAPYHDIGDRLQPREKLTRLETGTAIQNLDNPESSFTSTKVPCIGVICTVSQRGTKSWV